MTSETEHCDNIVRWGRSLFDRGLTSGSSGNISVRTENGYLVTPTNSCLGFLSSEKIATLDATGTHVAGDAPTKELALHLAFYEARSATRAVVHLHSPYATALSCLKDVDPTDAVPAITPYVVMRVGKVPVTDYVRPGSSEVGELIRALAPSSGAVLLGNHGPVVAGSSLEAAVFSLEELEAAARLVLMTRGMPVRLLDGRSVDELNLAFQLK